MKAFLSLCFEKPTLLPQPGNLLLRWDTIPIIKGKGTLPRSAKREGKAVLAQVESVKSGGIVLNESLLLKEEPLLSRLLEQRYFHSFSLNRIVSRSGQRFLLVQIGLARLN